METYGRGNTWKPFFGVSIEFVLDNSLVVQRNARNE
jgi:hypothetical protein